MEDGMMIDTTINIDRELLDRLEQAVCVSGIPREKIISCLMQRVGSREMKRLSPWCQVKYQARREKAQWKKLHLDLRGDEYEYYNDLKKVMKLSVSHIIAMAIEQYLEEIVKLLNDCTDNYHYHNYIFSVFRIDDVVCLVFYWGIPRKLLQPPI
jgi:hypothetical protein